MKRSQLEELLKNIVNNIVNELSLSSSDKSNLMDDPSLDSSSPPESELSSTLQAKIEREKEKTRRDNIKTKEAELKTVKSKLDMQKKETDQARRFTKPSLEKDIQRLKGASV